MDNEQKSPSNQLSRPFQILNLQIRETNMYKLMKDQTISYISNIFINPLQQIDSFDTISQKIKSRMDRLYGPPWHCIVGKGFGSAVTFNNKNMLFLYISNVAILLYRH